MASRTRPGRPDHLQAGPSSWVAALACKPGCQLIDRKVDLRDGAPDPTALYEGCGGLAKSAGADGLADGGNPTGFVEHHAGLDGRAAGGRAKLRTAVAAFERLGRSKIRGEPKDCLSIERGVHATALTRRRTA